MTRFESPMQTKSLSFFWHKANLRLVERPESEAPVIAMSRPSLFGGGEEFIWQYPAELEPLTVRDIACHRFTIRHGKKRRKFKAPNAATFDAWISALMQAQKPNRDAEHLHLQNATRTHTTTANDMKESSSQSQDDDGCKITCSSSRTRSYQSHVSTTRSNALRPNLERPCFTRDTHNFKLIKLHRPASTIEAKLEAEGAVNNFELDDMAASALNRDKGDLTLNKCDDNDESMNDKTNKSIDSDADTIRAETAITTQCKVEEPKPEVETVFTTPKIKADAFAAEALSSRLPSSKEVVSSPSTHSSSNGTERKWVPLDPTNSRLLWMRRCAMSNVAPRDTRRQEIPPRRRVSVNPSSTRAC